MQEELSQQSEKRKEDLLCVTRRSNCRKTHIGDASVGNEEKVEKAGQKAECIQAIEKRQSYEIKTEKQKFIRESFQLDMNAILNTGWSNVDEAYIGGASVGNTEKIEKAGRKAECIQTIENRQSYKTEEEK